MRGVSQSVYTLDMGPGSRKDVKLSPMERALSNCGWTLWRVSAAFHELQCSLCPCGVRDGEGPLTVGGDWEVSFPPCLTDEILPHRQRLQQPDLCVCWVLALYTLASHEGMGKPLLRGR